MSRRALGFGIFVLAVALLPWLPVPDFWISQLNYIGLFALVALGLVMVYSASIAVAEASKFTGGKTAYFLHRHAPAAGIVVQRAQQEGRPLAAGGVDVGVGVLIGRAWVVCYQMLCPM